MMKRTVFILLLIIIVFGNKSYAAIVVQYHHISDKTPRSTSTSPRLFLQHMEYLEKNNFKVISLSTFIYHLKEQIPFDDKSVLITFDDGYSSIFEEALPVLKEKDFPFTVFINAKPIEQKLKGWMSWKELKELQKFKGEIANHSYEHAHLIRRLKGESKVDWKKRISADLIKNQMLLEKHLNIKSRVLAYPYGEYDKQNLKPLIAELDFMAFAQHSGAVSIGVDQQAIPRFAFGGAYGDMGDFKIKINSLPFSNVQAELLDSRSNPLKDHVLTGDEFLPQLRLTLSDHFDDASIHCYFSGQGKVDRSIDSESIVFKLKAKINPGRSRFNCTSPSKQKGRFHWYSHPVIRSLPGGQWYKE